MKVNALSMGASSPVQQDGIPQSNGVKNEAAPSPTKGRLKNGRGRDSSDENAKRRCVSTACIACRKAGTSSNSVAEAANAESYRTKKIQGMSIPLTPSSHTVVTLEYSAGLTDSSLQCDGNTPACAACSSVYNTECVYDPGSDHRRKGVYKRAIDNLKTRNSTLQTLIQAILNYSEEEVPALIRQIRTCENLETVAESILVKEAGIGEEDDEAISPFTDPLASEGPTFETELHGKMGSLQSDGVGNTRRFFGDTSNLVYLGHDSDTEDGTNPPTDADMYQRQEDPATSWTTVTTDHDLILHLMNMYFTWHYTYFATLPMSLFYRDFLRGKPPPGTRRKAEYCTPLLVNAMLALGCHFTSWPGAREVREDSATAGDHFFKEAKRLLMENDEHENPCLTTVQALALMSVREAGCGREARGWVYSGMSFRMACDLGLNLDSGGLIPQGGSSHDEAEDARRITFWGCFLFDK